jgi:hypothetical protein
MIKKVVCYIILAVGVLPVWLQAQVIPSSYNVIWNSQSTNSGSSMPCGGGDIGLNVWVENGELLLYMAKSGMFDEHNALLKAGRIRVKCTPNPFSDTQFAQELKLQEGYVSIQTNNNGLRTNIKVWVDVFRPVIHIDVSSNKPVHTEVGYESWRYTDRLNTGRANNANSYKWAPQGDIYTYKDSISFREDAVWFYHRNRVDVPNIFDVTVQQQGMDAVKDQLYNPLSHLIFGGMLQAPGMQPAGTYTGTYLDTDFKGWKLQSKKAARSHTITVVLHTAQTPALSIWSDTLQMLKRQAAQQKNAWQQTRNWWQQFWQRSFIVIQPQQTDTGSAAWQAGRNYQLFRYMLGCNAFGNYPTKFNGGLFTYDPSQTDTGLRYTPDFRNWGGGIHTAQNQRLVYFPMLKSGDFDLLQPQLDFYLRIQRNAELRSQTYWQHKGACFTEQLENFGLPNSAEYAWKRPPGFDKGLEYNAWLEYEWDTVLEFCLMMLESERYGGKDIRQYVPFIESCLRFFHEHYQYLANQRGRKNLDGNGHLVLYPGSAAETYKMTYNSSSTVAGLKTVLTRLLELPSGYLPDSSRTTWQTLLSRIPPISFRQFGQHTTIAPAQLWERVNNTESPQLYPVFPWGIYGVGHPGLDTAINTYKYDTDVVKFKSSVGWKQHNIFAARLGLKDEAALLTFQKLQNSGRRFPAFWGPGFDWTPDHNWGGSGMIGLQEMLMQVNGRKIYLFPAWPGNIDVHFKLHAPYNTTVEATLKDGKLESLIVMPEERKQDVVNMLGK